MKSKESLVLKCPKCGSGSDEIVFQESRRKPRLALWRLAAFCGLFLAVILFVTGLVKGESGFVIAAAIVFLAVFILSVVFRFRKDFLNSKTHTKAICKHCGNTWFID